MRAIAGRVHPVVFQHAVRVQLPYLGVVEGDRQRPCKPDARVLLNLEMEMGRTAGPTGRAARTENIPLLDGLTDGRCNLLQVEVERGRLIAVIDHYIIATCGQFRATTGCVTILPKDDLTSPRGHYRFAAGQTKVNRVDHRPAVSCALGLRDQKLFATFPGQQVRARRRG